MVPSALHNELPGAGLVPQEHFCAKHGSDGRLAAATMPSRRGSGPVPVLLVDDDIRYADSAAVF